MQVSVEAPSQLERRLTVVVPVERLNSAFDKRIANLAKNAKIDGFRPGKAPVHVVKQRFGDTARQEALSEVIQSSLYEAINQEKLDPVGTPMVEPKMIDPTQPLEYVATFEIMPEVKNFTFKMDALEKQVAKIEEADIDNVVKKLCEQHITWEKVDRAAEDKDQVVIDFSGSMEGKKFEGGQAHDYPIVLGSKTMIPGFEEGVVGLKAGDEKVISVTFPENYYAKEFAGKQAEFDIKVHKVSRPIMPEMNEDFIKKLGIKSANVEALRTEIRRNLERELERVTKAKVKKQVFDQLLAQNPMEIPKALIDQEAQRIHDQVHPHHGHEHEHTDAEMEQFKEAAKHNVALGLLVAETVKQHKLAVDKDRVEAYLTTLSSAYENPAEVLQWYRNNKNAFAEAQMLIMEEQVVEKLIEGLQVTEKQVSYNELIK